MFRFGRERLLREIALLNFVADKVGVVSQAVVILVAERGQHEEARAVVEAEVVEENAEEAGRRVGQVNVGTAILEVILEIDKEGREDALLGLLGITKAVERDAGTVSRGDVFAKEKPIGHERGVEHAGAEALIPAGDDLEIIVSPVGPGPAFVEIHDSIREAFALDEFGLADLGAEDVDGLEIGRLAEKSSEVAGVVRESHSGEDCDFHAWS